MCDLFSWVKDKDGKIWFNRDEDIEIAGMDFQDGIGHSAIEKIWKVSGEHLEGVLKVPKEIAQAVNRGKCDKMIKAAKWTGLRYTKAGIINVQWWPKSVIKEAKKLKYFDNHAEPLPEWKVYDTWDAAWDAAWNAASDSARDAAWDAARDAARDAAWAAAMDSARAAARDAALLARCELAFYDEKTNIYLLHARKRWEVYQRGYGLVCDVKGVFYVCRKP